MRQRICYRHALLPICKMSGQRFSTPEGGVDVFRMLVLEIPQSEWQKCFDNWFKPLQKIKDLNGKYFQKPYSDTL